MIPKKQWCRKTADILGIKITRSRPQPPWAKEQLILYYDIIDHDSIVMHKRDDIQKYLVEKLHGSIIDDCKKLKELELNIIEKRNLLNVLEYLEWE
jgi:hypothetical protein